MLFVVIAIIILALMFTSTGIYQLTFGAIFVSVAFVGFWVMLLRLLIGFGRWLMNTPPERPRQFRTAQTPPQVPGRPVAPVRTCSDPRCARVNLAEARFCAQCGRPLGQAA